MQRFFVGLLCGIFLLGASATAQASLVTFEEIFLGNDLDDKVDFHLNEGYATFGFDLTSSGGLATLYNSSDTQVGSSLAPSTDATGFEAGRYTLNAGTLLLDVFDKDSQGEEVVVKAETRLNGTVLGEEAFALSKKATAELTIDLTDHLSLLEDGMFLTFVITPEFQGGANSIHIDRATLSVDAAPVPIPAALPLMLSGLGGLYLVRRKLSRS